MSDKTSARLALGDNLLRGLEIHVLVNGIRTPAFEGETVAAVLMAESLSALRTTLAGEPRGVFCGMGVCFDCLVVVDQIPNTRACMTWAKEGMVISTQSGLKASH